jgi:exodeoxyribonuclease VII large subunit
VPILRERAREQHRRLRAAITHALERRQRDCTVARRALNAVNPLAVLDRGYAILFDDNGRTVRSAQGVAADAILEARLSDGILKLRHIPD